MSAKRNQRYHVVGVAGVGMNALAQVLLASGHGVSGSDRFLDQGRELDVLQKLQRSGVKLVPQDGSGVTADTAGVVISTAIEPDNADLAAAQRHHVPVVHRAEMLAHLAAGKRCIAVTGTSGKTTVTGMIGWILECLGEDPTVVNGGALVGWATDDAVGNIRIGTSDLWVIEADESDRSLLRFEPEWAVITNISRDHFEVTEAISLFAEFAAGVRTSVVCGPGVSALLKAHTGRRPPRLVEATPKLEEGEGAWHFAYRDVAYRVPVMGRHNAENACVAVVLCAQLGLNPAAVREALASFGGIQRRLERVGEAGGAMVIDDYAHNPAKITAAWKTAASSSDRVIGIWRPHGYGPLAAMMDEWAEAFAGIMRPQDELFVLPVFDAGGTANRTVTADDLLRLLRTRGLKVEGVESWGGLLTRLVSLARTGDAILCMGARDPDLPGFTRDLLRELAETTSGA